MEESFVNKKTSFGNDPPVSQCPEPIAIVGMGCRWPGSVHSESQLWDMLCEKRSGFSEFKKSRINVDGFYHPSQNHPGTFHMRGGFFLDEDPRLFDNNLFRINAIETRTMDPAQRKLLEVTYEAFENAGEPWENFAGSKTGVFVGNFMSDHQNMQFRDPDNPMPYVTTGGDIAIHSNRINYVFNLKGPSLTLDTACSSAMYALHIAVSGIRNGDCEAAIVAGSNLISDPGPQMFITKLGALSPTSISHTFDATADGYARAEGVGALYIMPLSRAVAGSYPIRAVIRGTAINANGQSEGISYPSPAGQEAVIRQAYRNAGGLDPALTGYFEAHGTGTPVGDPIEVSAIGQVFSRYRDDDTPLLIGSIKPNLGHSESASAIASIMKAVMALEKGEIPPTRGITKFNPRIDFKNSRTKVVTEMTPWPVMPIRRASVNSFGYGGANAHVILDHVESVVPGYNRGSRNSLGSRVSPLLPLPHDLGTVSVPDSSPSPRVSADISRRSSVSLYSSSSKDNRLIETSESELSQSIQYNEAIAQAEPTSKRLVLLPFSANDDNALKNNIREIGLVADNFNAVHLAHDLAARRSKFAQRAFVVSSSDSVASTLQSASVASVKGQHGSSSKIGFIFTGQGAQWPSMGRGLLDEYPVFQASIRYQDQVLARLSKRPSWNIEDILIRDELAHLIHEPMVSQTVCTALQIALVELLSSWGINPSATVGHSSGEIGAAYAASRLTAAEAIVLAYFRGYTVSKNERKGSMLAVGLGSAEVESYIAGFETEVRIAACNSPKSVTISGETAEIEKVAEKLKNKGIFNRILKTGGNAYHSHHMQTLGSTYEHDAIEGLEEIVDLLDSQTKKASVLWVSSVCPGQPTTEIGVAPSYWRSNLESPVLFDSAVDKLLSQSSEHLDILLEVGPHPALAGPVKQILQASKAAHSNILAYIGSLNRNKDDLESIFELAGNLFTHSAPINIDAVNGLSHHSVKPGYQPPVCLHLPNYKYNYGPILFHENRLSKEWRLRKHPRHDLLGSRQLGGTSLCPSWRNMFRLRDVPWLGDHRLIPKAIFPAAGFIAMAIEASFQSYTESDDMAQISGYTLRNVSVSSTLEIPDTEVGTDVVTNLQKKTEPNGISENWYEFKISSLNTENDSWVEHCTGLVKVEVSSHACRDLLADDEQNWHPVDMKHWYSQFTTLGLEYGPSFQALSNLKAAPSRAAASISLAPTRAANIVAESNYPIHPASLDNCLQLANIAAYSGDVERAKQAYIPVMFNDLTIWNRKDTDISEPGYAVAEGELRGSRGMYSSVQLFTSSGEVLVDMKYFRGISYDGIPFVSDEQEEKPRDPFSRLLWKPDIEALSNEKARDLFPITSLGSAIENASLAEKLDRFVAYLVIDISEQYGNTEFNSDQEHLKRFMEWIVREYTKAEAGDMPFGLEAVSATPSTRYAVIQASFKELDDLVEAKLIRRVYENMSAIFAGEITGLELALGGNLLVDLYSSGRGIASAYPRMQDIVDLLVHKNPRMKILEIGGGTGGATKQILATLEAESSFKRFSEYAFTDLAPTFLSTAEQNFAACRGMNYSVLDIEVDPLAQGFAAGEYDLVIASQVLHSTRNLENALQNVRKLLRAGGKLLLVEFTRVHPASTFALGTFPYYWNGADDGRSDGPLAGSERWESDDVTE